MTHLQAAILDEATFNANDLNLNPLLGLIPHWHRYPSTPSTPSTPLTQRVAHLKGINIAVANKVVFDQPLLSQLPDLKVILLTATGMDNVDLSTCKTLGIAVFNEDFNRTKGWIKNRKQWTFTLR